MVLIDGEKSDTINENVEKEYLKKFPLIKGKYKVYSVLQLME